MTNVYVEVYGCSANKSDHEILLGLLKKSGMEIVDSTDKADINLITTCAVKSPTVNRMIFRTRKLTAFNKPLIIAGCLPKVDLERRIIEKINPNASFIGPDALTKVVDVVHATLNGEKVLALERVHNEKAGLTHLRTNPVIDVIQINSGCLSSCAFCATKLARGNLYSYRPYSIREQLKHALVDGCKEIWLTSQDSGAYGRDIGTNLPELLESITRIEGKFFVRVGMMNPLHLKKFELEHLIEVFKNEKIFKFLHLCVQSGSNNILKIMRRGYKVEDFIYYVEKFREEIPELSLATDIIVGHPGEEEDDFNHTVELIKEIKPDIVNLSKFGSRPGTDAEKMRQMPANTVNERSKILSKIIRNIAHEKNKKWIGWKGEVLINGVTDEFVTGSNYTYKPVMIKSKLKLGNTVKVRIEDARSNFLIGRLV